MSDKKTLRDYFAAKAMAGSLANSSLTFQNGEEDRFASWCYKMADAMLAERAKNATKYDEDGWIEWNGGKCPVSPSHTVEVKIANNIDYADNFRWSYDDSDNDIKIIAYRLVK